ncbi:hypothetical protein G4B88_019140 [Cannabis sativa]|uniref:Uncharacterized protein n=1 Tax=Cannabis sativa TaxID=3483 RepID=A0A7J6HPT0_CANSA|nr:hypothetical protein G4B88_019140 [Cannabis sativa]
MKRVLPINNILWDCSQKTSIIEVALEAVGKGAHIVKDVSFGLDSNMFKVVADLKVASELYLRLRNAEVSGIPT